MDVKKKLRDLENSRREKKLQRKMKSESGQSELARKNLHFAESNGPRKAGFSKALDQKRQRVKDATQ